MYEFCFYFLMLFVFSVVGWITECIYCSIGEKKLVLNRGFLIGPYCPIYGFGTLYVYFFMDKFKDNYFLFIVASILGLSILEYLTSYFMEKIFHARWWDYSNRFLNINGRVCFMNAMLFGLMAILFSHFVLTPYVEFTSQIPRLILIIVSLITLLIFVADYIVSFNLVNKLKEKITDVKKDSTEFMDKEVRKILSKYFKFMYKEEKNLENSR